MYLGYEVGFEYGIKGVFPLGLLLGYVVGFEYGVKD